MEDPATCEGFCAKLQTCGRPAMAVQECQQLCEALGFFPPECVSALNEAFRCGARESCDDFDAACGPLQAEAAELCGG